MDTPRVYVGNTAATARFRLDFILHVVDVEKDAVEQQAPDRMFAGTHHCAAAI